MVGIKSWSQKFAVLIVDIVTKFGTVESFKVADATGKDDEYISKIQPKEIDPDLFLFCTELNARRFRNDDLETIEKLTKALGVSLWKHAVVVFTFANEVS